MSDAEWESWQSSWQGAAGPLPDIRARARTRVWWHRVANVAFFAMMAAGLAGFAPLLAGRDPEETIAGWIVVIFCVTFSIGFAWMQRGLGVRRIGNPRDALAFLERRVQAEFRGAEMARVCFVALGIGMGVHIQWMLRDAGWPGRLVGLGCSSIVIALALGFPWWVRRRVAEQQREIVRWRTWMDEQQL